MLIRNSARIRPLASPRPAWGRQWPKRPQKRGSSHPQTAASILPLPSSYTVTASSVLQLPSALSPADGACATRLPAYPSPHRPLGFVVLSHPQALAGGAARDSISRGPAGSACALLAAGVRLGRGGRGAAQVPVGARCGLALRGGAAAAPRMAMDPAEAVLQEKALKFMVRDRGEPRGHLRVGPGWGESNGVGARGSAGSGCPGPQGGGFPSCEGRGGQAVRGGGLRGGRVRVGFSGFSLRSCTLGCAVLHPVPLQLCSVFLSTLPSELCALTLRSLTFCCVAVMVDARGLGLWAALWHGRQLWGCLHPRCSVLVPRFKASHT